MYPSIQSERSEVVDAYLSEIRRFRPLAREPELDLARHVRAGCPQATARLIQANLGFVVHVAKEYRNNGLPFEDLVSEGNLGLIQAARRFDGERGMRFITYAVWWIRKSILQALSSRAQLIRVSEYHRQKTRMLPESERAASLPTTVSLEAGRREKGRTLGHRLVDPSESPEKTLLDGEAVERVRQALGRLKPQQQQVVTWRFGLGDEPTLTLREVGRKLGISGERARQVEQEALRRLRHLLCHGRHAPLPRPGREPAPGPRAARSA
jgi:RNA polymerase primary sigma factor